MYENKTCFLLAVAFVAACILSGCHTTKNLHNYGERDKQYREIQSDIRNGETELAVAGEKLEHAGNDIAGTVESIASAGSKLEQSIGNAESNEQGIGNVLQRVRAREISGDIATQLREKYADAIAP